VREARKRFFFEKKKQKTSIRLAAAARRQPWSLQRRESFFASFCSQKEVLPS
jgi:hypothetical protein